MRILLLGFCLLSLSGYVMSESEALNFRGEFRPEYNNTVSVQQLHELQSNAGVTILDVRLEEDLAENPHLIPGAEYKNPEEIEEWIYDIDKSKDVVVYCVAGKWVSQKVAYLLDQAGIKVQSLEGGMQAWNASQ